MIHRVRLLVLTARDCRQAIDSQQSELHAGRSAGETCLLELNRVEFLRESALRAFWHTLTQIFWKQFKTIKNLRLRNISALIYAEQALARPHAKVLVREPRHRQEFAFNFIGFINFSLPLHRSSSSLPAKTATKQTTNIQNSLADYNGFGRPAGATREFPALYLCPTSPTL